MTVKTTLAVGEKAKFLVSNEELANVLGRYVAERQGIMGTVKPLVEVCTGSGQLLRTEVTLERTK